GRAVRRPERPRAAGWDHRAGLVVADRAAGADCAFAVCAAQPTAPHLRRTDQDHRGDTRMKPLFANRASIEPSPHTGRGACSADIGGAACYAAKCNQTSLAGCAHFRKGTPFPQGEGGRGVRSSRVPYKTSVVVLRRPRTNWGNVPL